MENKRTEKQMRERAIENDWYGISDNILKKMIEDGEIENVPPAVMKRLGLE
jgi:hypothetical protein